MNTHRSLHLLPVVLALVACASHARQATLTPADDQSSQLGAICAPDVRDEFVRQQALVRWHVYCPTVLPAGFRLARADDAPDANAMGGSAAPTIDNVSSDTAGFFMTRLVGTAGAVLVVVQGSGASPFVHRDNSGDLIGAPETSPRSPFGDLDGRVLEFPTPSIVAFDDYGHMIIATHVTLDETKRIAAAMGHVDPTIPDKPPPTPAATS